MPRFPVLLNYETKEVHDTKERRINVLSVATNRHGSCVLVVDVNTCSSLYSVLIINEHVLTDVRIICCYEGSR